MALDHGTPEGRARYHNWYLMFPITKGMAHDMYYGQEQLIEVGLGDQPMDLQWLNIEDHLLARLRGWVKAST